jgi:hypothetical protein
MRLSHPYVWVFLVIGTVLGGVALLALRVVTAAIEAVRRRRWETERGARAAWERLTASVEQALRITDLGDFRLVVRVPPVTGGYRDAAASGVRLKSIVRLAAPVARAIESANSLPVLVHPTQPAVVEVDLEQLMGDPAVGLELTRDAYVRNGRTKWSAL